MTRRQKRWAFLIVLVVGGTAGHFFGTKPTTRASLCEQAWTENRATAQSPTESVTEAHQRYIDSCMETYRDLEDGKLDGR